MATLLPIEIDTPYTQLDEQSAQTDNGEFSTSNGYYFSRRTDEDGGTPATEAQGTHTEGTGDTPTEGDCDTSSEVATGGELGALASYKPHITSAAIVGGTTVLTVAASAATVALVLPAIGFTAAGITAGSYAAGMMSSAAIANGGGVAAGSLVAILQSAATAGVAGVAGGSAAVGGLFGGLSSALWWRRSRH